jgi:hypothetical protein
VPPATNAHQRNSASPTLAWLPNGDQLTCLARQTGPIAPYESPSAAPAEARQHIRIRRDACIRRHPKRRLPASSIGSSATGFQRKRARLARMPFSTTPPFIRSACATMPPSSKAGSLAPSIYLRSRAPCSDAALCSRRKELELSSLCTLPPASNRVSAELAPAYQTDRQPRRASAPRLRTQARRPAPSSHQSAALAVAA